MKRLICLVLILMFAAGSAVAQEMPEELKAGMTALMNNQHQSAIEHLTKVIQAYKPGGADQARAQANRQQALLARASAYYYLKQYDAALGDVNLVINTKPSAELLSLRAEIQMRLKDYQGVKQSAQEAIRLQAGNLKAHLYLGLAHLESGETARAKQAFSLLMERLPAREKARIRPICAGPCETSWQCSKMKALLQRHSANLAALENPVTDEDRSYLAKACFVRARAHAQAGDYAKARLDMQRGTKLDPSDTTFALVRAEISYCNRDYPAAIESVKKFVSWATDNPKAYYILGMSYVKTGQTAKAIQAFTQALRKKPDHLGAMQALISMD